VSAGYLLTHNLLEGGTRLTFTSKQPPDRKRNRVDYYASDWATCGGAVPRKERSCVPPFYALIGGDRLSAPLDAQPALAAG